MLLWESLLNQQARKRCRIPDTKPEQPTPQVKYCWRYRCRQNRHPKHLHDEIDAGHDSSVKAVGNIARDIRPSTAANVVRLTAQPAATVPIVGDRNPT